MLQRDGLGKEYLDGFLPGLIERYSYEGRLYAIPFGVNIGMAVFYGVDALAKAGLPAPQEGWNWATFLDYCKKTSYQSPDGKSNKYQTSMQTYVWEPK